MTEESGRGLVLWKLPWPFAARIIGLSRLPMLACRGWLFISEESYAFSSWRSMIERGMVEIL
jgi:hypothetical protein